MHSEGDIVLTAKGRVHVNGLIFSREIGKPNLDGMSCKDKMEAAIKQAPLGKGVLDALGGAKGIAIALGAAAVIQAIPVAGEVEDAVAALALVGLALSGAQIIAGIKELKQFHDLCCKEAKTPADLKNAGKVFADAVGKIGVNTVLAVLGVKGLKGARGAAAGEDALSAEKIAEIKAMPKGSRPDPSTYMSQDAIDAHLAKFKGGATKIAAYNPTGTVGPPGGTFAMPATLADSLITKANGDPAALEQSLGLEPGSLGSSPYRIDITSPSGLRMSSGNELGANPSWLPGGWTSGGIPEATIDPIKPGTYTSKPTF